MSLLRNYRPTFEGAAPVAQIAHFPDGSRILPLANRDGQTMELVKESNGLLMIAIRDLAGSGTSMVLSTSQCDEIARFLRDAR
jgi:hypothetical protein